jgi:hypothetical protein
VAVWHGLALAGALLALLSLCAALPLLNRGARADHAARWRRDPVTLERLRRLDGRVRTRTREPETAPDPEQIASQLRRLQRMRRHGLVTQSEVWLTAVNDSYDRWLCQGCQSLGVPEELRRLDGLDRELERARIEELLRDKGF